MAWYHSHQRVTVVRPNDQPDDTDADWSAASTWEERAEDCLPRTYVVRFADGVEWTVFEDELSTTRRVWERPDPPRVTSAKENER